MSIAIVDYGMGNLFSVKQACEKVGLDSTITSDPVEVEKSDGVILPGVGAFGDAMDALRRLGMVDVLRRSARSGKPLVGVCLGMQLMMTKSNEFGRHQGLDLISGAVVRLDDTVTKVPNVGWSRIGQAPGVTWRGTLLDGLTVDSSVYFVHSYYVRPTDAGVVLAITRHGAVEFPSAIQKDNIFACQFHPERSRSHGLQVYGNLAALVNGKRSEIRA